MKTLNEVIEIATECNEHKGCFGCKHNDFVKYCDIDWTEWIRDALNYLKKYREDKNDVTTRYPREEEPDDYRPLWRFKELWE